MRLTDRSPLAVLALLASVGLILHASAQTGDAVTHWTPPPADPKNIEGVWLPAGGGNGPPPKGAPAAPAPDAGNPGAPPPEIGNLTAPPPGGEGAPPPGAAEDQVAGSTLECTPVQRLGGAGGGMSNLWIEGPSEIVMISEEDMDSRKIYLNRSHPPHPTPQPNGNSVGHWEGDTLVVDSIAFSKADGSDAGEHVIERIHKDGRTLIDEVTLDKNGTTTHQTLRSSWRSDLHVSENVCEENFSRFHFENGRLVDQTQ